MHILNVNSSLDSRTGGGTAERTFQMSRFLAHAGTQCTVLTIDTGLDDARIAALAPANVVAIPLLWRRFYVPYTKWRMVQKLVADVDIIHLMGHWSVLNALVYVAARRIGRPYVVCPAGALPIFGRSKLAKRIYNFLLGKAIIRNASAWIAVTTGEFLQFERYGIPASNITVIPNGVSQDDFPGVDIESFRRKKKLPDKLLLLFMGRLNLIKGPDLLLQAFASIKDQIPNYDLVFAGPDEGMQAELIEFSKINDIADRVHFLGFVSGMDKVAAYRLASLLIVPSRQEAMSIVALEAGICGTPVLLTDQCGFSEIRSIHPALETTTDVAGIANGITQLVKQADLLEHIAFSFQNFVENRYTWDSVVMEYLELYKAISGATKKV